MQYALIPCFPTVAMVLHTLCRGSSRCKCTCGCLLLVYSRRCLRHCFSQPAGAAHARYQHCTDSLHCTSFATSTHTHYSLWTCIQGRYKASSSKSLFCTAVNKCPSNMHYVTATVLRLNATYGLLSLLAVQLLLAVLQQYASLILATLSGHIETLRLLA
jgi:hypothetical protein